MYALVTGASSGIGLAYARELAARGHDLIVVSNQEQELQSVAEELQMRYSVRAIPMYADLTQEDAPRRLYDECKRQQLEVEILVNNAGVFFFNDFMDTDMERIERLLNLHVLCTTRMCRLFGEDMRNRRHGYILNMSSMSAWMLFPGIQCYNATKAYINNFSQSLWYEMHPFGVNVLSVTPGTIDTALFGLSTPLRKVALALHISMTPERLAKKALNALKRGRKRCMPGVINHLSEPFLKHTPDWLIFAIIRRVRKFMK